MSQTARWMDLVVLGWLVYDLTGSRWLLGVVAFFRVIPMAFLGPVGGLLADRLDRRKLLLGLRPILLLETITLAVLVLTGSIQVWHILALALVAGAVQGLDSPSRWSLTLDIVGPSNVTNAVALSNVAFQVTMIIGPSLGGPMVDVFGIGRTYVIMAAIYIIDTALLWMVRSRPTPSGQRKSPLADLVFGFRAAWHNPVILGVLATTAFIAAFAFNYTAQVPAFAKDVLGQGATGLGMLMTMAGVGALSGSIIMAIYGKRWQRKGLIFLFGAAGLGIMLVLFSMSKSYPLSLGLIAGVGLVQSVFLTMQTSCLLLVSSQEMRGRVMGLLMFIIGAGHVGDLLVGWIAQVWGAPWAVGLAGVACFVGVIFMATAIPGLRRATV